MINKLSLFATLYNIYYIASLISERTAKPVYTTRYELTLRWYVGCRQSSGLWTVAKRIVGSFITDPLVPFWTSSAKHNHRPYHTIRTMGSVWVSGLYMTLKFRLNAVRYYGIGPRCGTCTIAEPQKVFSPNLQLSFHQLPMSPQLRALCYCRPKKAIASRAITVITSGSDWRVGGLKCFWSPPNCSKTARGRK